MTLSSFSRILVTGSSGHLGEAMMRVLRAKRVNVRGLDIKPSPWTDLVGDIGNPQIADEAIRGVDAVLHTATLHKPHIATHRRQDFVDTNVTGTLNLLEAASRVGCKAFIFTSTTSVFGDALIPPTGEPAGWITEEVRPIPKNIYGVTKHGAEELCQLFHRNQNLPIIVLRTSRFFPEADDNQNQRNSFSNDNLKTNEFLHRRVDIGDAVDAHLLALRRASDIGFSILIVSATPPFHRDDMREIRRSPAKVLRRCVPEFESLYEEQGWQMFSSIDRVYSNERSRRDLGWQPTFDFSHVLDLRRQGRSWQSELAQQVGAKGYHDHVFADGPFPVE